MADTTAADATDARATDPAAPGASPPAGEGQHHPLRVYFVVWGWLFLLSAGSYLVDYAGFAGLLRWSLVLVFMTLKAGLIVAVFMHLAWERLALVYAVLAPPLLVLVLVAIMAAESDYTLWARTLFFGGAP